MQPDTTQPPKRGRKPTHGAASSDHIKVRTVPEHKTSWQAAAEAAGLSLSAWVVRECNRAAELQTTPMGKEM